eukprot:COSAG01_NODE_21927_length_879_cov_1.053846_3_plen_43_part_01
MSSPSAIPIVNQQVNLSQQLGRQVSECIAPPAPPLACVPGIKN